MIVSERAICQYMPHSHKLRMQAPGGRGFRWFLWIWLACQSLNALTQSQNDGDGPKIISDNLIRRYSITAWHFSFIWTMPLSFSSRLSMLSEGWITVCPKSSSVDGWYPVTPCGVGVGQILPTPAPTTTPAKTVDSDSGLDFGSAAPVTQSSITFCILDWSHHTEAPQNHLQTFCDSWHGGVCSFSSYNTQFLYTNGSQKSCIYKIFVFVTTFSPWSGWYINAIMCINCLTAILTSWWITKLIAHS